MDNLEMQSCIDEKCALKIAKNLNLDNIILGSIKLYGTAYIIEFKSIDGKTGAIISEQINKYRGEQAGLFETIERAIDKILDVLSTTYITELTEKKDVAIETSHTVAKKEEKNPVPNINIKKKEKDSKKNSKENKKNKLSIGKITQLVDSGREAIVNIGSLHGLKEGNTLQVFRPDVNGNINKDNPISELKVLVVDSNNALAVIRPYEIEPLVGDIVRKKEPNFFVKYKYWLGGGALISGAVITAIILSQNDSSPPEVINWPVLPFNKSIK